MPRIMHRRKDLKYPLEIKGNRLRVRQRQPIPGARFRTHDVGHNRHSERITMFNPVTRKWVTQSWTFPIADVLSRRPQTVAILKQLGRWKEAYNFVRRHA